MLAFSTSLGLVGNEDHTWCGLPICILQILRCFSDIFVLVSEVSSVLQYVLTASFTEAFHSGLVGGSLRRSKMRGRSYLLRIFLTFMNQESLLKDLTASRLIAIFFSVLSVSRMMLPSRVRLAVSINASTGSYWFSTQEPIDCNISWSRWGKEKLKLPQDLSLEFLHFCQCQIAWMM